MATIPIGLSGESQVIVTSDIAISFLGHQQARVLATPWMIAHMEMVSRDTVKPRLLDDEDTVGTQVNVSHLAATPLGRKVTFKTKVLQVNGQRVLFQVEAWDGDTIVGQGTHERFIINVTRFAARLVDKYGAV
ncbi:MAG TPA: thioesterase family protein [Chthoniobacterales bacterium]|nr:thioesterase family protein [Chthoniobacterales bacterium]